MTLAEVEAALGSGEPAPGFPSRMAEALWWDAKGDWARAHDIVAEDESIGAARIHAYLHRKEGDLGNAAYWYRRAGVAPASGSLQSEWRSLATDAFAP